MDRERASVAYLADWTGLACLPCLQNSDSERENDISYSTESELALLNSL